MSSTGKGRDLALALTASILILAFSFILVATMTVSIPPPGIHRWLSWKFLTSTYNWDDKTVWAGSPEVVTSVLWDYRGLDTVYETSVFFLAIIGGLMLVRDYKPSKEYTHRGMSLIARTITKIILIAVPTVAASVALHGHLTPGGGFQGGSIFAVSSLLAIVALGSGFLFKRGWSKGRLLGFRTLGLVIIASVILTIPVAGLLTGARAFLVQNQYKPWAPLSFGYVINIPGMGSILYSGSLIFLNLAEFLAVSAGLSLAFVVMSIPTRKLIESGGVMK